MDEQEIERRLRQLQLETGVTPTQMEIEERLAKLTNRDPSYYSSTEPPIKIFSLISKQRAMTDEQKTDLLFEQILSEAALDDKRTNHGKTVDEEIEQRLARLRQESAQILAKVASSSSSSTENQQQKTKQKDKDKSKTKGAKIADTGSSYHTTKHSSSASSTASNSDDEVSKWCSTCNEDGVLRCINCDNDVYCQECFRELHRDQDMRNHRTQPM